MKQSLSVEERRNIVKANPAATPEALALECGCSIRTILRDRRRLQQQERKRRCMAQDWESRLTAILDRQLDLVAKAKNKATKGQISRTRLSRLCGEILSCRRKITSADFPLPSDVQLSWQCEITAHGIETVPVQRGAVAVEETAVSGTVASLLQEIRELESTQHNNLTPTQVWQIAKAISDLTMKAFHALQAGEPDETPVNYIWNARVTAQSAPSRPFDLNECLRAEGLLE